MEYPLHYLKNHHNDYGMVLASENEETKDRDFTKVILSKIPKELKGSASANTLVSELVQLNDDMRYSFEQIADWIEDNVEFVN